MKNYYELLEVSENASQEVIEKAYKALVKKYHPDLQPAEKKHEAENKIKMINEAYEILSDKDKKEKYDEQLKMQKIKEEQLKYAELNKNRQNNTNTNTNSNINNKDSKSSLQKRPIKKPQTNQSNNFQDDYNQVMNEAYNNAYQNAYNQAYINSLKNMGYQIKYERPFKEKLKTFFATILAIIVFVIICLILWQIPFIKNYFINLYNSNSIFKILVDLINNVIKNFISIFT